MKWRFSLIKFFVLSLALALSACATKEEADPPAKTAFAVTVNVTQVDGTNGTLLITLANGSNSDTREITADGRYSFTTLLANTAGFSIDIEDPDDKACIFVDTNDIHTNGVIDKDDMEFSVTCTDVPNFALAGSTTGINSTTLTLRTIITRDVAIKSDVNFDIITNGDFTLASNLREGDAYAVTIVNQPSSDTCNLSNGSGTVGTANIDNIIISCTPNTVPVFNIGGTASNIATNTTGVTLQINGGNDLTLTNNNPFTFGTPVPDGNYTVTLQDPASPTQICTFANATKSTDITINGADVNTLAVNCVTQTFAISGTINALASNSLVVTNSDNNEQASFLGDPPTSYAFATDVQDGRYTLTIQDPSSPSQRCRFTNDRRSISVNIAGGNVNDVDINCVTRQYNVLADVDVTNLTGTLGLELVANSQVTPLNITNTTTLPAAFAVQLDDLTQYTVNIVSQPASETCTFPGSQLSETNTLNGANATTSTIACVTLPTFAITGQVDGLIAADSIGLQIDNATNDTASVSGDAASYAFNNLLDGTYTISITPLPVDYDCLFPGAATTAAVTVAGSNVSAPTMTCRQKLTAISLADANLSNCLATELAGPPVKTYVDEITILSCAGVGVADLTGVGNLFNLATLNLPDNGITNIGPLTVLNNLSSLDLSNNLLTDTALPDLVGLGALTNLNLGNDLALANQNAISQVPNIAGLISLNLDNNTPTTPAMDLTNLSALIGLLDLSVNGNSLADLTSFTGITQLTSLSISGNALGDVTGLAGITDLQTLLLLNNTVAMTNLSSLAGGGLPNIATIDLSGNAVTLCSEVESLKSALTNPAIVTSQSPVAGADCAGPPPATEFLVSGDIITSAGTGLTANSADLVLRLNGANDLSLSGSATSFAFTTPLPIDTVYAVTVFTQPTDPVDDIFCTVSSGGSGTGTADVTDVVVDCSTNPEVAAVAAFNSAQGISTDIFNQCLLALNPTSRVNQVGSANAFTNPAGLSASRTLDCSNTSTTDFSGSQYLKAVTDLNISDNQLGDTELQALTSMTQLIILDASLNQIGVVPNSISNLSNLEALNLANNQIIDVSPLAQLSTISSLELQSNSIGGLGTGNVDSLVALDVATNIDLNNNNTLMSCTELQILEIALNGSTDVVKPAVSNPQDENLYTVDMCFQDL